MAKAIHMMIRVLDEERSVEFYDTAFGLKVADRLDFENFTLVYLRNAETDFEIELTVNKSQTDAYDLGNGYGHVAFSVDDLDAEHARLTKAGLNPRKLVDFAPGGPGTDPIARFFFIQVPDGYEIEVLQRCCRWPGTPIRVTDNLVNRTSSNPHGRIALCLATRLQAT